MRGNPASPRNEASLVRVSEAFLRDLNRRAQNLSHLAR